MVGNGESGFGSRWVEVGWADFWRVGWTLAGVGQAAYKAALPIGALLILLLLFEEGEEDDVADGGGAGEHHDEAVDAACFDWRSKSDTELQAWLSSLIRAAKAKRNRLIPVSGQTSEN